MISNEEGFIIQIQSIHLGVVNVRFSRHSPIPFVNELKIVHFWTFDGIERPINEYVLVS